MPSLTRAEATARAALLTVDPERLPGAAAQAGSPAKTPEEAVACPRFRAFVDAQVETVNQSLARYESVRRHKLLADQLTVEGGELTPTMKLKRRVINQRYALVLFGNGQKLELHPWQAADEMTVRIPFKWDADAWYRMNLRVDNQPGGTTLVRGKVWKAGDAEPAAWTIEKSDPIGHREGSPGVYGDGISEIYLDNLKVYKNQ